jgi:hypothetical protein
MRGEDILAREREDKIREEKRWLYTREEEEEEEEEAHLL